MKEEKGPPLEHRLEADTIKKLARKAGLTDFKTIKLEHMILFRMKPKNNL
jgi:hypothetical protein